MTKIESKNLTYKTKALFLTKKSVISHKSKLNNLKIINPII